MDISFHSQKLLVGSIYRPLDWVNFFEEFPLLMENIWRKRRNIVLLGDFNVNLLPSLANSGDPLLKLKFLHHLNKFNLKNVINTPTRIACTGISSNIQSPILPLFFDGLSVIFRHFVLLKWIWPLLDCLSPRSLNTLWSLRMAMATTLLQLSRTVLDDT